MTPERTYDLEPENEMGVTFLFARYYDLLGFDGIVHVGTRCPDCIALRKGKTVRVEFEHRASNFLNHGHALTQADVLVCWVADADLPIETMELRFLLKDYQRLRKMPVDPASKKVLIEGERRQLARKLSNRPWLALLELDHRGEGLDHLKFASSWAIRPPTAAHILLRLVRRGWASRKERIAQVPIFNITESGREVAEQVKEARPELYGIVRMDAR